MAATTPLTLSAKAHEVKKAVNAVLNKKPPPPPPAAPKEEAKADAAAPAAGDASAPPPMPEKAADPQPRNDMD